jgi:microcystin-dependent protein
MATVTGASESRVAALEASAIKSAGIDANGHLNLVRNDNTVIDGGSFQAPTGCVQMFAGGVVPSGWLLCNGQALNRITYAALFAVIGTAHGAGDGSTTFNIPNMEAKLPRMQAAALGGVGGAATHTHVIAAHSHVMGAHAHDLSSGSPTPHAHIHVAPGAAPNLFMDKITGVASWTADNHSDANTVTSNVTGQTAGARLAGFTANAGGATNTATATTNPDSPSNLPPYVNLNFIIKA